LLAYCSNNLTSKEGTQINVESSFVFSNCFDKRELDVWRENWEMLELDVWRENWEMLELDVWRENWEMLEWCRRTEIIRLKK
jgi:hypothetical protein